MNETNPPPPPQYPPYPYYQPDEDELSLVDLWNIVWKRKWLWLTLGPLAGVLGIFYSLAQIEIYRAEVTMAPNAEERSGGGLAALAGQFGSLASMAGLNAGGRGSTETALATLKSRKFIAPFLLEDDRLKLLFPKEWDPETNAWTVAKERRGPDKRPTDQEAYDRFTKAALNISDDKKNGLVTLAIELPDPAAASNWANELSTRLNDYLRQQAKVEAERNLEYLNKQLQETQMIEIRQSLYTLIEAETKNAMLANAKDEFAFKIIDPAVAPEKRVRPKRTLIVMAAGLLGGFLGLFLCFILHFVDTAKRERKAA